MNRRTALAGCFSGLAMIAVAAPGQAAAGEMRAGNYVGDDGVNNVTVAFDGTNTTFTDSAGITNIVTGWDDDCIPLSATSVRCPFIVGSSFASPRSRLRLDDGNDSFSYVGGAPPLPAEYGRPLTEFFSVDGGAGADLLNGTPYGDVFEGGGPDPDTGYEVLDPAANDQLFGHGGEDKLHDSDGSSNRLEGGAARDDIDAETGTNVLLGGAGDDWMGGGDGVDTVDGEDGVDNVSGGDGADTVRGGAGNDDVEGGGGQDVADGGAGNDNVQASFHGGGCSADTLIGGAGKDSLYAACGVPTMKMRDGTAEEARCLPAVKTAIIERDATDELTGGACERKSKQKCKTKKGRKGASAAKAKCKKKPKRK